MKKAQKKQLRKDLKVIRSSPYFDATWYNHVYPDVPEAGMKPDIHFALFGWKEGRNPSINFETRDYLRRYPDVAEADMNPLVHYELYGKEEGRIVKGSPSGNKYEFSFWQKLTFGWECWLGKRKYKAEIEKNKHARILVCLHLFYMDSWPLLAEYLSNLKAYNVDYVITYVDGLYDKETLKKVQAFSTKVKLVKYPNAGFDIGSFVDVLKGIDLDKYDIVFKLHSKGISRPFIFIYDQIFKKSDWFFNLWNGVLNGMNVHRTIDQLMSQDKVGLVAASNLIIQDPLHKQHFTNEIATRLGVQINKEYHYVAGTCFAMRASLLKPIQKLGLSISDFEGTRRGFFSLAHGMERLVCACVEPAGYIMQGNPTKRNLYSSELAKCREHSSLKMLHDDRFRLDYEFFYKALETVKLVNYEIIDIKLGDIMRCWRGKIIPLSQTHPFKYLQGEIEQYKRYTEVNKKIFGYSMTTDRFEKLKESLESGFDPMFMPVLDEKNCLRDGQHRSCLLLHKHGPDYVIKAIRIKIERWKH